MSDIEARAVQAIEFLSKAATYFENRPTHGEDKAHWANVFNAKNCRDIANLIARLAGNGLETHRSGSISPALGRGKD